MSQVDARIFGTNNNLDLEAISREVEKQLRLRTLELGKRFSIEGYSPLQLTPDKGYTARGEAKLVYSKRPLGIITPVLFRPDDGTGNNRFFQITGVPPKFTPRKKSDYAELYLSIGTAYDTEWLEGITSLEEHTLIGETLLRLANIPIKKEEWEQLCKATPTQVTRREVKTLGFTLHERRDYGNPHVIMFQKPTDLEERERLFQVGAFVTFSERTKDFEVIEKIVDSQKH